MDSFEYMYDYEMYKETYTRETKKICLDRTHLKSIKVTASKAKQFSAEDLLNLSLPFGCVINVQKTVKNGSTCSVVTYSNADDAAVAMKELNCIAGLVVDLVDTRYVGETHRDETSEYPCDWFPQDMYSDMPPQRLPSVDTSYAFYREHVCLRIHNLPKHYYQRKRAFRLLPKSTISVKEEKKSALVTLPDFFTAEWVMDILNNYYIGSKRLWVTFAFEGDETRPSTKPPHRRYKQQQACSKPLIFGTF